MGHIYKITHTATGRFYIGMTTRSINERFYHHVYVANSGRSSHFLANAIRKYGRDAFELETVEFVRDDKDLPDREIFWIAKLRPTFNMTAGGEVSPMLNPIVSKKNGDARRGVVRSDETKAKMSAHVKTKEHRANLSAALVGAPGRRPSDETRWKMSNIMTGRKRPPFSDEWRARLSEAGKLRTGNSPSPETRAKISATLTGVPRPPFSPETKAKMAAARAAWWARKRAAVQIEPGQVYATWAILADTCQA